VGDADIEQEFTSPQNSYFVLHDSKGFEPGDVSNFDTVRKFIQERLQKLLLKDQIHGIWYVSFFYNLPMLFSQL
jgi:hypothetical protein